MATLKKHHKEYIVKQLACFDSPSEVAKQLKELYGVDVSLSQLSYYNPENTQACAQLSEKWRHLFHKTREEFIDGVIEIPIVHRQYRLLQLQKIYDELMERGDYMDALKVLEQAAKEAGGMYGDIEALTEQRKKEKKEDFYQKINQKIIDYVAEVDEVKTT